MSKQLPSPLSKIFKFLCCLGLILACQLWGLEVQAGQLENRVAEFPNWVSKPVVQRPKGDLIYPAWMEGTWEVTSTLIDAVAPLAPEITTPGFESNDQYLNQPIHFQVRFQPAIANPQLLPIHFLQNLKTKIPYPVVAERSFNGLNIAKSYLGEEAILSVKVDPNNPNRQITLLNNNTQLISTVTGRATETLNSHQFIATEVTQQFFRNLNQIYLNEVETTTFYDYASDAIHADQMTAIYLSPQDPNYFKAGSQPVALYRYQLELTPTESQS